MQMFLIRLICVISMALAMPNLSALTAPQRYNLQKTSPALLAASNKGIEALLPKEDIRTFRLLNRLPKEIKGGELFKRHFTTQELVRLYDDLSVIKQNLDESTGSNIYDVSDLLDPQGNFKGNNILAAIQDFAARKLAKKINCTVDSMQDGSCQPLITSTDPKIPEDQKQRKPFEEITKAWTKDWIKVLSGYEHSENKLPEYKRTLLPVNFLRRILNTQLDQKLHHAFIQAVAETAREKGFKVSIHTFSFVNNPQVIHIDYVTNLQWGLWDKEPSISLYRSKSPDDKHYDAQICVRIGHDLCASLNLDDLPKKISITGGLPYKAVYQEEMEIILKIIKTFAKALGALSLEISYFIRNLSNENRTFYEQRGFREKDGKLVLDLANTPAIPKEGSCTIL